MIDSFNEMRGFYYEFQATVFPKVSFHFCQQNPLILHVASVTKLQEKIFNRCVQSCYMQQRVLRGYFELLFYLTYKRNFDVFSNKAAKHLEPLAKFRKVVITKSSCCSTEPLSFRGFLTQNILYLADFLHEALLDFLKDTLRIL